jgi:hypothetical protein
MTLPGKTDVKALTSGEDVEGQISPDGTWVAYAKAKVSGGSDYHNPKLWKLYLVSIHGVGSGRKEIKIDDSGVWPSWSKSGALFYNQPDGTHTTIVRVTLDDVGRVKQKQVFLSTKTSFSSIQEVTECFVAPDESWFAARTRGTPSVTGVSAFLVSPPTHVLLARAGQIGCMPYVSPDGTFGIIAGASEGIRWGNAPQVASRKEDQQLIAPRSSGTFAYHPGISTDGGWVMASQGTDTDHNSGRYDLSIYPLDATTMTVGTEQALSTGGFNGWPHVWVGQPGSPPLPKPEIDEFYPSSYTVAPNEKVTLTWTTLGSDRVTLDGASVSTDGTKQVQPSTTTAYTLVAKSSQVASTDTGTTTVTVNSTPQAVVIDSFTVSPQKIEQGSSATVSWTVRNPTTLDLDGTRVAPTGSVEVEPLEDATYVLTARGDQGPVEASATLSVVPLTNGLLPDRGGFFACAVGPRVRGPGLDGVLLVALVALLMARGRRARR